MGGRLITASRDNFRILQLTDLHFTDGSGADLRTLDLIEQALAINTPDLVTLTGDIIFGLQCPDPLGTLSLATRPITKAGIPWTIVFGNHDDEGSASRLQLMQHAIQLSGCLSCCGPDHLEGIGNYILPVRDSQGGLLATLAFLDSGSYAPDDPGGYAWVQPEQTSWLIEEVRQLTTENGAAPLLLFLHIPIPEYNDILSAPDFLGQKMEDVCSPRYNSGLASALNNAGVPAYIFCGHDHINDYSGSWKGLFLAFGRASGWGGYGWDRMAKGARIVDIAASDSKVSTFVWTHTLHRH